MLRKLLKYEFKATSGTFLGLYIMVALLTVASKVMITIQDAGNVDTLIFNIFYGLIIAAYVVGLIAVAVVTLIMIIKRFYDSMLKDEGYLSFTLPATVGQHIASKAIASYVWFLATALIAFISIFALLYTSDMNIMDEIHTIMDEMTKNDLWGYALEMVIMFVISIYSTISIIYVCLSLGQLYAKHRIVGAVIAYIAIYMINQVINAVYLVIVMGKSGLFDETAAVNEMGFVSEVFIFEIVLIAVEAIIFTLITNYTLSRKLNLE